MKIFYKYRKFGLTSRCHLSNFSIAVKKEDGKDEPQKPCDGFLRFRFVDAYIKYFLSISQEEIR